MRRLVIILIYLSFFIVPRQTFASTIFFNDSFTDMSQIDISNTTAEVDEINGWVTLSQKRRANSLILYENLESVTIINGSKVETYIYNGENMILDDSLSIAEGLDEPANIWGDSPNEYFVLDRGLKEIRLYQNDGYTMISNPFNDFNFSDDCQQINMARVGNSLDLLILDKGEKSVKYYTYDGSSYILDEERSIISGFSDPISLSVSEDGFLIAVIDGNEVKVFQYDGTAWLYNYVLSIKNLYRPLDIEIRPGHYAYAVLQHDSTNLPIVSYFAFDGNGMLEVPMVRISGLTAIGYENNQLLMGQEVLAGSDVSGLKLTAEVDKPSGTDIKWEATVDGVNWLEIKNKGDAVRFCAGGNSINYRAFLYTQDSSVTPKILNVKLYDASLWVGDFKITEIVGPVIYGNPLLPTDERVYIWAGYNVVFQIETRGNISEITAEIKYNGKKETLSSLTGSLYCIEQNSQSVLWEGVFHTNSIVPIGTLIDITFTIKQGDEVIVQTYNGFAEIFASALKNHPIHLTH